MNPTPHNLHPNPPTLNPKSNLHQILAYKKAYQIHVRKLSQIRTIRKSNLNANNAQVHGSTIGVHGKAGHNYNPQRNLQIEHIKDVKHNNFMFKLNQEAGKIQVDNLRLFDRLNREMNSNRSLNIKAPLSLRAKKSMQISSTYNKLQRKKHLQKQNKRLQQRINSSHSHISNERLWSQQRKRQQIKSRIRKFDENEQLKSERYFSVLSTGRDRRDGGECARSCNLVANGDRDRDRDRGKDGGMSVPTQAVSRSLNQGRRNDKKIISFYNPRQVIMNKIQNFGLKYKTSDNSYSNTTQIKYKQQQSSRPRPNTTATSINIKFRKSKQGSSKDSKKNSSFFATQNLEK